MNIERDQGMAGEAVRDDDDWTRRCVERLIALDPALQPALAEPIAIDLCSRARWRAMPPEAAAQTLFDYGRKG